MSASHYPALMLVVRHGRVLAALCGLLVVFIVSGGLPVDRASMVWAAVGLGAGALTYLLLRGLQDLLRLVAERMIEP